MKTHVYKILNMLLLIVLSLAACEKEGTVLNISDTAVPGSLSASSATLVLTKASAESKAITFSWSKTDFGYPAAVTYTLQMALAGNNFTDVKEVQMDAGVLSKEYTVLDFNALLLAMSLPTGTPSSIEVRMKSVVSAEIQPAYSAPVSLSVNPYPLISYVFVPGDYQGWEPTTADSLISPVSNGIYEGIVNFPAKPGATFQFKVTPAKNWNTSYGNAGGGKISTSSGDNLTVPEAGSYKLTVDLNDNTFSAVPFLWSIIGDAPEASNWNNDIDMKYDNGKQLWAVTVNMQAGNFKFRKNHDWGTSFGDKTGDMVLDTENDNNIKITAAGSYRVELNLIANTYSVTRL